MCQTGKKNGRKTVHLTPKTFVYKNSSKSYYDPKLLILRIGRSAGIQTIGLNLTLAAGRVNWRAKIQFLQNASLVSACNTNIRGLSPFPLLFDFDSQILTPYPDIR